MFIQVQLLNGFPEPLWYQDISSNDDASVGAIIHVPLRNRIVSAIVMKKQEEAPNVSFAIKPAIRYEPMPRDPHYQAFIKQLSNYYQTKPFHFIKRMKQFLMQREIKITSTVSDEDKAINQQSVSLTQEQRHVISSIEPHIITPIYYPSVLHGVTGSGKTEIYKRLITTALKKHKSTVLLLPEVSLALEMEKRISQELGISFPIFSFHSATATKQKRLLWKKLVAHEPVIILGVHLPLLLPIANLGLIIVDEEHDIGYQEKKHPKVNSKEAAIMRAHMNNIPIILGSATPSVTSLYNVKTKNWHFFQLKKRFAGSLPRIQTVQLTDKKQRRNFWISNQLYAAIKDRLSKKEQIIIFLNRRGHSFFVQCKSCSFIVACPACSVSLTLHSDGLVVCHYCGYHQQQPEQCPSCKKDTFIKKGIGTQQVVSILNNLFPYARIARADLDVSKKKDLLSKTIEDFHAQEIDILVGTQTITKGYHFPHVTLVGILWADLNLNFPIYNASETTLQQIIQVAGRAGRQSHESEVIVQTMSDHTIYQFINEIDYLQFYRHEIEIRKAVGYPPYKRLIEIELKHTNEIQLEQEAHDLAAQLSALNTKHHSSVQILGPAKPPVHKIKNLYNRKIYLKAAAINECIALYQALDQRHYRSHIFFTPNPSQ